MNGNPHDDNSYDGNPHDDSNPLTDNPNSDGQVESSESQGESKDRRLAIGLTVLGSIALLAWWTMEAGRFRYVVWLVLGFSAFRMVMFRASSRYSRRGSLSRDGQQER